MVIACNCFSSDSRSKRSRILSKTYSLIVLPCKVANIFIFCRSDLILTIFLFLIIIKSGGKKIKVKKKRQFTVIIEEGEDGYLIGTALELKGCHTQGKTVEEVLKNIREAIELYLEVEGEEEPYIKEIVGIQKVAV